MRGAPEPHGISEDLPKPRPASLASAHAARGMSRDSQRIVLFGGRRVTARSLHTSAATATAHRDASPPGTPGYLITHQARADALQGNSAPSSNHPTAMRNAH